MTPHTKYTQSSFLSLGKSKKGEGGCSLFSLTLLYQ